MRIRIELPSDRACPVEPQPPRLSICMASANDLATAQAARLGSMARVESGPCVMGTCLECDTGLQY